MPWQFRRPGAIIPMLARTQFEPWRSHPKLLASVSANVPPRQLKRHAAMSAFVRDWEEWAFRSGVDPLPIDHANLYMYFDYLVKIEDYHLPSLRAGYTAIKAYQFTNSFTPVPSELMSLFFEALGKSWNVQKATILSPDQIYAICDLARATQKPLIAARDIALILVAYDSSSRPGSARRMRYEDIKWDRSGGFTFAFVNYKKRQPALEEIPVGYTVEGRYCTVDELKRWLTLSGITSGPVFPSFQGERMRTMAISDTAFREMIATYAANLGVDGHFSGYSLRRGSATALHEQGHLLDAIRDRLGHEDVRTTRGYIDKRPVSWKRVPRALP